MKKNNLIKTIGFSSMALFMGALTIFGFVPMAKAQPLATASETATEYTTEEPAGLITPHAEDPILYTTESGLDIKFGLATPDIETSLATGNLQGFPYFTTTSGSTTYTWVIIGQAQDKPLGVSALTSYVYSTWTSLSDYYVNKKYFTSNIRETTTPAGSSINSATSSKSYVIDRSKFGDITTNAEISSGCVLVLANDCVATGAYNITRGTYYGSGAGVAGYRYSSTYYGDETIAVVMENYYKNKNFGLDKVYSKIQTRTISTYSYYLDESNKAHVLKTFSTTVHLFPFGMNSSSSYYWANYLTANQVKCSTSQWVRGRVDTTDAFTGTGPYYLQNSTLNASGNYENAYVNSTTVGYRPAFVLKIT